MSTDGTRVVPFEDLKSEDIVIVPAFGSTIEIEKILTSIGIEIQK